MRLIVVVVALAGVEALALLKGIDGTALAAFFGAVGAILGFGGRKALQGRKK